MKTAFVCTAVLLLMTVPSMAQSNGSLVYLDDVDGLYNGHILVGSGYVTFNLGCMNGDGANKVKGLRSGFQIYGSDSSVNWEGMLAGWDLDLFQPWDVYGIWGPTNHRVGADTVGFYSTVIVGLGIPPGYAGPFVWISVALTDTSSVGGTICLDSSWFPPDGVWLWAYGSAVGSFPPAWDGPHCWPVIGSCCLGQRGNVDSSPDDLLDIADLVYLVDYMFTGGPVPPCWEEADIDGSGGTVIDITDLVHMMDYMFDGGPPPAACP